MGKIIKVMILINKCSSQLLVSWYHVEAQISKELGILRITVGHNISVMWSIL